MVLAKIISSFLNITLRVLRRILVRLFGVNYDNLIEYICEELRERVFNLLHLTQCKLDASILNEIRDKTVVITGGDTDLGHDVAKVMLENGVNVIIGIKYVCCAVLEQLKEKYPKTLVIYELNMASMKTIIWFATNVRRVDILINNAIVMLDTDTRQLTEEGLEMHFGSNHLGHFFLTLLLQQSLNSSRNARVVIVSSASHMLATIHFDDINFAKHYNKHIAYFQSKLANVLFARELSRRLSKTNLKAYCVHPGYTRSQLNSKQQSVVSTLLQFVFNAIVCMSESQSTQTILYCALDHRVESGYYYTNCRRVHTNSLIVNDENAQRLWDVSCDELELEFSDVLLSQSTEEKWKQQTANIDI